MLDMTKTALIIIDVQGKLATLMYKREEFFANMVKIAQAAKVLELPIFWNEQLPDKLGPTIPELKDVLTDIEPLPKNSFSCYGNPEFRDKLKATHHKQILLTGMETHVCVYQTAMDLITNGYEVYLVADAVSSRTEENKLIGIQAIKMMGANITSVEMCLFEMLKAAEGDKFKQIIKIVK